MDGHPDPASEPPPPPLPAPARQRWRLVVARAADAPRLAQREVVDSWLTAFEAAGLPVARSEGATARPRVSFGAPLPLGMAAEGELIDVVLTDRWPAWRLREALALVLPEGWRVQRLEDVWLGGPPLAGRVAAADHRITLGSVGSAASSGPSGEIDVDALRGACTRLLQASALPRERAKGDRIVAYDLRPLLLDVQVTDAGPPIELVARTRFHPELGTGRPEEVVAALSEAAGLSVDIDSIVRARLLLADEVDEPGPG